MLDLLGFAWILSTGRRRLVPTGFTGREGAAPAPPARWKGRGVTQDGAEDAGGTLAWLWLLMVQLVGFVLGFVFGF